MAESECNHKISCYKKGISQAKKWEVFPVVRTKSGWLYPYHGLSGLQRISDKKVALDYLQGRALKRLQIGISMDQAIFRVQTNIVF